MVIPAQNASAPKHSNGKEKRRRYKQVSECGRNIDTLIQTACGAMSGLCQVAKMQIQIQEYKYANTGKMYKFKEGGGLRVAVQ